MSENLSKDQIVTMLTFNLINKEKVWDMYKSNLISLEDYCYCLAEWEKEKGNK